MINLDRKRIFIPALMTTAVLAGLGSLFVGLGQSVWFDEVYSVDLASQSWGDIMQLTAKDVHPPLYYWLLKAWTMLFGQGEVALRSMSVLFFSASIVVTGLLLRKLFGAKTALMALPFILFAPFLLRYGFEIRMYSLASLIGVSATYVLMLITESRVRKERWLLLAAYAVLVALGVYTLYFMVLIWLAHLIWLALRARDKKQRKVLFETTAAYMGSFLLFVPWLPNVLRAMGGGTLSPVTDSIGLDSLTGIVTYMFLYRPPWQFTVSYVLAIVGTLILIGYLSWYGYRQATPREQRALTMLATYFAAPIIILTIVTQFLPIYLERYIAHFAIAGYGFVGVAAALSLRRADLVTKGMVVLLLLVSLSGCMSLIRYGNYNFQRVHTPSIKLIATYLTECKDGAVIFADGPQVAVELGYYVTDCPVYFFNETLELGGGFAMISNSPYRVADASELPETKTILHVFYNEPKNTLPKTFIQESSITIEKVSVASYRAH